MPEEYVDPEFPEMESQPEEMLPESEWNPEPEVLEGWEGDFGETPILDELGEQVDLELVESPLDAQDVFLDPEYPLREVPSVKEAFVVLGSPPREDPVAMGPDSGGVLFLPESDPIQQPVISDPLDPSLVYTREVPKRLRHLTCERRGSEYQRPVGLYRPMG